MITFENVRKSYGNHEVLKGISFSMEKGERIALIGASGAGKSTLLHLLTTASEIDAGSIMIDNKPIDTYVNGKKRAEKIGIMRQQFDLVLPLKVINNVLVGRLREWGFFKSLFLCFFTLIKKRL